MRFSVLEESGYEDGYIAWSVKPIALRNFMNTQCSRNSSRPKKALKINTEECWV